MSQSSLLTFSEPQTALPVYNCSTCKNRQGHLISSGGHTWVRCFGSLKEPRENCPSWSDGNDLAAMLACAPPADFVPKKYAGGH